jgi:hypothetical protein
MTMRALSSTDCPLRSRLVTILSAEPLAHNQFFALLVKLIMRHRGVAE